MMTLAKNLNGRLAHVLLCLGALALVSSTARAQSLPEPGAEEEQPEHDAAAAQAEIDRARAEAARAQAEAEAARAQAEAELARLEAERARLELEQLRAERGEPPPDEVEPEPVGVEQHDGFLLNMALGFGLGTYHGEGMALGIGDPSDMGGAGGFSISIGGCVAENLAIHGDLWALGHFAAVGEDRRNFGMGGLGIGLTYYFMPANVFLGASLGPAAAALTRSRFRDESYYLWDVTPVSETTTGLGAVVRVGKEWWISDNWGMGLAAHGMYTYTVSDDLTVHAPGALLMFSVTYN